MRAEILALLRTQGAAAASGLKPLRDELNTREDPEEIARRELLALAQSPALPQRASSSSYRSSSLSNLRPKPALGRTRRRQESGIQRRATAQAKSSRALRTTPVDFST